MKKMAFTAVMVLFSASVFAQDVILKECSVRLKFPETIDITMKIVEKSDKSLMSSITQTYSGYTMSHDDVAEISEGFVRENLSSESDHDGLNEAERIVVHAMRLSEEPSLRNDFQAGIDLKKIRFAKMYAIGARTNMGSATIVEARDENNQTLGSFLGGFLVSPCL